MPAPVNYVSVAIPPAIPDFFSAFFADGNNSLATYYEDLSRHLAALYEHRLKRYNEEAKKPSEFMPEHAEFMPPTGAEKLLALILTPDKLEEVLGDFDESYRLLIERHGVRFARSWYRWQVAMISVRSVGKLTWRAAKAWFGGFGSA